MWFQVIPRVIGLFVFITTNHKEFSNYTSSEPQAMTHKTRAIRGRSLPRKTVYQCNQKSEVSYLLTYANVFANITK